MTRLSDLAIFTDQRLAKRYATRRMPMTTLVADQVLAYKNLDAFDRPIFLDGAALSCSPSENSMAAE